MRKILLLITISIGLIAVGNAQTKEIKVKGIFKEIDVYRHNETIEILNGKNKKSKKQAIDSVLNNPNYYNPPVIYALSKELFNQNEKDEAMYWFYVAQLRARYDANLCMDKSAKQAVSVLNNEYGPEINKYAFQDIDKLEKTVNKVVEFISKNEENFKLNADSIAELIGTLYVLEGSRLGGNVIVKALRKNQNLSEISDFHFYGQPGINIRERWISLMQIGNSLLTSPEATTTAAEKATAVFQYFHAVFQPEKLSI